MSVDFESEAVCKIHVKGHQRVNFFMSNEKHITTENAGDVVSNCQSDVQWPCHAGCKFPPFSTLIGDVMLSA